MLFQSVRVLLEDLRRNSLFSRTSLMGKGYEFTKAFGLVLRRDKVRPRGRSRLGREDFHAFSPKTALTAEERTVPSQSQTIQDN